MSIMQCVGFDFADGGVWLTFEHRGRTARAGIGIRGLEHAMGLVNHDQARALLEKLQPKINDALTSLDEAEFSVSTAPHPEEPPAPKRSKKS